MNKAILILSHQLLSMVAPIKKIVEDNGYACYVLSSTSSKATAPQWEIDEKQFSITSSLYLEKADIDLFCKRRVRMSILPDVLAYGMVIAT